jgi:hypothetical protein
LFQEDPFAHASRCFSRRDHFRTTQPPCRKHKTCCCPDDRRHVCGMKEEPARPSPRLNDLPRILRGVVGQGSGGKTHRVEIEPATRAATGLFNPLNESVKSYAIFHGWENAIEKRDSDYQFNPALLSRGNTILIVRGENRKGVAGGAAEAFTSERQDSQQRVQKRKCR